MKKVLLLILDGFGFSKKKEHNAILNAEAPFIHELFDLYPYSLLRTDGEYVGLPEGVMGNSEVGHISIGSGRVIYQDLSRISKFIQEEGFVKKQVLHDICGSNTIHIMGLLSDGGVHSHIHHLMALLDFYHKEYPDQKIALHLITDGRDTSPDKGIDYIKDLESYLEDKPQIKVASLMGRYYAMDRDKRWDRVEKAYQAVYSDKSQYKSASDALLASYDQNIGDEFLVPVKIAPIVPQKEDAFVFFNFRSDRAREISMALAKADFSEFSRSQCIKEDRFICFTSYSEDFSFPVLFPKEVPKQTLGEVIEQEGLKQLRIAETEKYAHVTYFFNGGEEKVFQGEDRILVPSPKDVATYDLKPEMSAPEVTDRLLGAINSEKYHFIVCNYANGDMVGHTGVEEAAIQAVEALDRCLKKLIPTALAQSYEIFLTADHGNCEEMADAESGKAITKHSMNPVPFMHISKNPQALKDGALQDIAPSILQIMGITKPQEMTGKSLLAGS
tara:strand:+ start:8712 stop:10214 length:1503 start_codon:yes stop_codon:yes gene_type:complete